MFIKNSNKISIYEYIDLSDTTLYFNKIEKIAEESGKWSIEVLLNDLEKHIIFNENLNNYKINVLKILKKMDNFYKSENTIKINLLHNKCLELFHDMINMEIHDLIKNNNKDFYNLIKNDIYRTLKILDKCFHVLLNDKNISNNQENKLNQIINKNIQIFQIKRNIVKRYNNNLITHNHEDSLFINLHNIKEAKYVINYIDNNKKIYEKVNLPKKIMIKENNKYITSCPDATNMLNKSLYRCNIGINNNDIQINKLAIFKNYLINKKIYKNKHKKMYTYKYAINKYANNIKDCLINLFNQYIMFELYTSYYKYVKVAYNRVFIH